MKLIALSLLVLSVTASACTGVNQNTNSEDLDRPVFAYRVHNGLDCHMMGDCGHAYVLTRGNSIEKYNDQDESVSSVRVSKPTADSLVAILHEHSFFELPSVLPDIPEENIPRGGKTVTMTFAIEEIEKQVRAYPDVITEPIPPQYFSLEESIRSFFLRYLESE